MHTTGLSIQTSLYLVVGPIVTRLWPLLRIVLLGAKLSRHSDGLCAGRPWVDSRQGQEISPFSTASRSALGPTQYPYSVA
jgi:hypothetical protein